MAVDDKALQSFFQKQKKASTDALVPSSLNKGSYKKHTAILPEIPIDKDLTVSKPLAAHQQTVSNTLANREQTVSNMLGKKQNNLDSVSNALAEALAQPLAKCEQSVSKPLADHSLESLVGKERQLLLFLFDKCKTNGSLETPIITSEELRISLKIKANHIRNLVFRLANKGFLTVKEIKNGRAGWRKFTFSKDIYQSLILDDSVSNTLAKREQTVSNTLAKPLAEALAETSSSSSLINNNKTTTEENQLPPEWQEISLTKLHERNVRFGKEHIIQLFPFLKNHSAFDFQESIDAFIHDIDHGHVNEKRGLLNLFIGAIRNGTLYISSHYVSPYQQKLNEMVMLAEQRAEQAFLAWLEENRAEVLKQIEAHDISLAIDFKHGGKESLSWIRQNVYLKLKKPG